LVFQEIKPTFGPIKISSKDSIAHAKISMLEGRLKAKVWAQKDIIKTWQDSIMVQNKIIENKNIIIKEKKATIEKKNSFIYKLKIISYFIGAVFLIFLVVLIIVKF
jgi:hypothetical protein